jgi:hypothetical protein
MMAMPAGLIADFTNTLRLLGQPRQVFTDLFKGIDKSVEDPYEHALKAEDWMQKCAYLPATWPVEFRHTLGRAARGWYDTIVVPATWAEMREMFEEEYDPDGKRRQWRAKWRSFAFNPETDDISKFIASIRRMARKLGHNDEEVTDLIKDCMPRDVFASVCRVRGLVDLITTVKDIFMRDAETKTAHSTPFAKMTVDQPKAKKRVVFDESEIVKDTVTEVLNAIDSKAFRTPWRPRIYPKRGSGDRGGDDRADRGGGGGDGRFDRRGGGRGFRRNDQQGYRRGGYNNRGRDGGRRGFGSRDGYRNDNYRGNDRGRPRGGYTRPPPRRDSTKSRPMNKDNDRCHQCNNFGHWKGSPECPQNPKKQEENKTSFQDKDTKGASSYVLRDEASNNVFIYRHDEDGESSIEQLNC